MKRLLVTAFVVALALASTCQHTFAFDGHRKGFVLGYGAGVGWSAFEKGRSSFQTGVHTNLKLGWGVNDRTLIHYSGHFFVTPEGGEAYYTILLQPTASVSHYLRSTSPSLYGTAGVGLSADVNVEGFQPGPHVAFGVGYEAFRHWSLELDVIGLFTESWGNNFDKGWLMTYVLTLNVLGF